VLLPRNWAGQGVGGTEALAEYSAEVEHEAKSEPRMRQLQPLAGFGDVEQLVADLRHDCGSRSEDDRDLAGVNRLGNAQQLVTRMRRPRRVLGHGLDPKRSAPRPPSGDGVAVGPAPISRTASHLNGNRSEAAFVDAVVVANAFLIGAAVLGLWLVARYPHFGPQGLRSAALGAAAAYALLRALPELFRAVAALNETWGAALALLLVLLPGLTVTFWLAGCLVRAGVRRRAGGYS
jgi:hypothetical protein